VSVEINPGHANYGPHRTDRPGTAHDQIVAAPRHRKARRRTAQAVAALSPGTIAPAPQPSSTARMVSTIAHELRTPLATLHAGLEVLSDYPDLDSADVRQLVSRLQRGVAWLDCLIENLTTWSAIETGHLLLRRGEGSVLGWIDPAIELVQPQLARRGQRVRLVCPSPTPVVSVDSVRLGQVIVNLLVNAGKYGVQDDEIVLTVEPLARGLRIAVTDHGAGIPLAEQGTIFRPHTRGAAAMVAGVAGHGLGLSIVKAIVEAHGGEVGVDSAPGEGTTFWFTVPSGG
jgi:signal transduction histidine kinase